MAITYPKTNSEKAELYVNALHETRVRLRMIELILKEPLADLIMSESCHLQLRLCCECFAVGCLAAQGDFETNKALRDDYSPVLIFKALEASNAKFFPTPSTMQRVEGGWHFDDVGKGNTISRSELEGIWQMSGDHLHRTSAKKYLKRTNKVDFIAINRAAEKLWNLILDHMIILADGTSRLHVNMDRTTDQMTCQFLFLDVEAGTATVEPFTIELDPNAMAALPSGEVGVTGD